MRWIKEAGKHKMVVGSQARILYSDQRGRVRIAQAFNEAVRVGRLKVGRLMNIGRRYKLSKTKSRTNVLRSFIKELETLMNFLSH